MIIFFKTISIVLFINMLLFFLTETAKFILFEHEILVNKCIKE